MLKLYEYLYYRLYTWNKKLHGEKDGPEFNASLGIAMFMGLHFVIFIAILDVVILYYDTSYNFIPKIPKYILIGVMVVFIAITYFWFVHKKKYLKIIKKYEKENKQMRQKKLIILWLFFLGSLFFLALLAIIGRSFIS